MVKGKDLYLYPDKRDSEISLSYSVYRGDRFGQSLLNHRGKNLKKYGNDRSRHRISHS